MAAKDKRIQFPERGEKKNPSLWKRLFIVLVILAMFVAVFFIAYFMNHITVAEVDGNSFYSDDDIRDMVMNGELEHNAWYLYWKYQYSSEPPQFPFVDKIEVELAGRGHVKIHVYEKSIVGYVEYLGNYMYFDKDGTVVESSAEEIDEVQ